ncbi:Acyltransferase family [Phytophthora cinnamomi]|uniref:Acyltransferase family n=1 Tax=Phytophthora cinnamomi TaxID=4785 RepID=UPI00355990B4|nr:Acyltransferase family [Phytophthora cinnamomi]
MDKIVPSMSIPLSAAMVIEALMPSAIARAFEWNLLCFTGKISFSIYLLHPFVNFLPWLSELPHMDQFVAQLILLYSLASASYIVVERNCERLAVIVGKRLSSNDRSALR